MSNNYQNQIRPTNNIENHIKSTESGYQGQDASVTMEDLKKTISDTLNGVLEKHPECKKVELEALPITTWKFKITLYQKN